MRTTAVRRIRRGTGLLAAGAIAAALGLIGAAPAGADLTGGSSAYYDLVHDERPYGLLIPMDPPAGLTLPPEWAQDQGYYVVPAYDAIRIAFPAAGIDTWAYCLVLDANLNDNANEREVTPDSLGLGPAEQAQIARILSNGLVARRGSDILAAAGLPGDVFDSVPGGRDGMISFVTNYAIWSALGQIDAAGEPVGDYHMIDNGFGIQAYFRVYFQAGTPPQWYVQRTIFHGPDDVSRAMVTLFDYLRDAPLRTADAALSVSPPASTSATAGTRLGPYTVHTTAASVSLSATGGSVLDASGAALASASDGDQFWLSSPDPASVTVRAEAEQSVPTVRYAQDAVNAADDQQPLAFVTVDPVALAAEATGAFVAAPATTVPPTVTPAPTTPTTPAAPAAPALAATGPAATPASLAVALVLLALGVALQAGARRPRRH